VAPRFDIYRAAPLKIREIFAEYTPLIEPLSLDEAYLDVTENLRGIAFARRIAQEIRAKMRQNCEQPACGAGPSLSRSGTLTSGRSPTAAPLQSSSRAGPSSKASASNFSLSCSLSAMACACSGSLCRL
jgi:hypothetical protein